MKRIGILLAAVVAIGLAVLSFGAGGPSRSRAPRPPMAIQVIASNAPSWVSRTGGPPDRYLCSGTNDEVQLQAAADAAAVLGGVVKASSGTFLVSKPSEADQVSVLITDCTATDDTPSAGYVQISAITWDGTDTIADVEVGQIYRLSVGDDEGGGDTIEDNEEWYVGTVTAVAATTFDLDGELMETYDQVVATRLVAAIELKEGVSIIGAGLNQTYIKLADQQNCDVIHTEPGATWVYARLQDLSIDGNKSNQGDEVAANFDGSCNGIVLNGYAIDVYLNNISVVGCKGDGMWILSPWGVRIMGGWTESCVGTGVYLSNRSITSIWGHKFQGNSTALALREAKYANISGCDITVGNLDEAGAANAIRLLTRSDQNTFTGNSISALDVHGGAGAHCIYLKNGTYNTFTGNHIYVDGTKTILKGGAAATNAASFNMFVGNSIRKATTNVVHDLTGNWQQGNKIQGNSSTSPIDQRTSMRGKNTSGAEVGAGSVMILKAAAAGNEFTVASAEGQGGLIGVLEGTIADNGWGNVQTRGKTIYLMVDGTDNIAVGDLLSTLGTDNDDGIAQKAHAGHVAFAIALEVYETDDANGIIDALLIDPVDAP